MSLLESLFHPRLILALPAYVATAGGLVYLVMRLEPHCRENILLEWMRERVFLPLSEAAALIIFMFIAYPALYGIPDAPALGVLIGETDNAVSNLVNLLFIAALLLPLLPVINRFPGSIVLGQALLATAVMFHWLAMHYGQAPGLLPEPLTLGMILVWSWAAHRLQGGLATPASGQPPARLMAALAWPLAGALQLPSIVLYAHDLGARLRLPATVAGISLH